MAAAINTFRIWRNINGSPVKVTVRQGQTVTYRTYSEDAYGDWEGSTVALSADGSGVHVDEEGAYGCPVDGATPWARESFIPRGFTATNAAHGVLWPTYVDEDGMRCPVAHLGHVQDWS